MVLKPFELILSLSYYSDTHIVMQVHSYLCISSEKRIKSHINIIYSISETSLHYEWVCEHVRRWVG